MITLSRLVQTIRGLDGPTVEFWLAEDWVRPRREAGEPVFEDVDVARIRLILELRDELEVGETAIPVVLSLLDELHAARGRMARLCAALQEAGDAPARRVVERLSADRADPPR